MLMVMLSLFCYPSWEHVIERHENEHCFLTVFHALHFTRQTAVNLHQIVGFGPVDDGYGIFIFSSSNEKIKLRHYSFSPHIKLKMNRTQGFFFSPEGNCLSAGELRLGNQRIIINDSGRLRKALAETAIVSY